MITIRIHLTGRQGKKTELLQLVGDLCLKIAAEPGCISCQSYQSPENPVELVVIEEWQDETIARAHLESVNFGLLIGAGYVQTHKANIMSGDDPATKNLRQSFEKRMVKAENL